MPSLILTNGTFVTPSGLIEGSLVAEDGVIVRVDTAQRQGGVDLHGALVAPGFIDLHNDGLEGEINPRPGIGLPLDFALGNFDRRAAASGITLALHAITFAGLEKKGRSLDVANERALAIRALGPDGSVVEHGVLFRADVWQPDGLDALFERAAEWTNPIVTLNDHTPGQGQYRDIGIYRSAITKWTPIDSDAEMDAYIATKIGFAAEHPELAEETFRRCAERVRTHGLILGSHDDDSPERTTFMRDLGATIAEFPVTIEAAWRARELGMTIVAGAPNIVRGGSHSGNVSAVELVDLGLCDILVADYHAPSLLLAVQRLADRGVPLASAIAMVSANPARAIGRSDLGAIEGGKAATLTVVSVPRFGPWQVRMVIRNGEVRATFESGAAGTTVSPRTPSAQRATPLATAWQRGASNLG